MDNLELRKSIDDAAGAQRAELAAGSWWHSIDLGAGLVTRGVHSLEELRDNYARFNLPEDLSGKTLLDIGCWDGFYSFEAERHGARVTSVDCWRPENFFKAREALNSQAQFHELSVYEVTKERLGSFDIVLFLGVLYHLRHPLLALEQVCEVTRDFAVIETHVIDDILRTERPVMEFYEFDELGGQYDNWWGPNVECLAQMTRAAGFARVELLRREPTRATIKAYRRWEETALERSPSLRIVDVTSGTMFDHRRHQIHARGRHAFVAIRIEGLPPHAKRWDVKVEIGGFAVHPVYVGPPGDAQSGELTQINAPVPAGLDAGKAVVRVWSEGRLANDFEIELIAGSQW